MVDEHAIAFVSVGSNVHAERNIFSALWLLQRRVHVASSSSFYRTEPLGGSDQPAYINGVWRIETTLTAEQVKFDVLRAVENELGRHRGEADKFGPRSIDLDLVLYEDVVIEGESLTLPHPDIERVFVHVPLLELLDEMPDGEAERFRKLLSRFDPTAPAGHLLDDFTKMLRQSL